MEALGIQVFQIICIVGLRSPCPGRCWYPSEQVNLKIGSILKSADQNIIPTEIMGGNERWEEIQYSKGLAMAHRPSVQAPVSRQVFV